MNEASLTGEVRCDSNQIACFTFIIMTEEKTNSSPDIQALAREACDLWQEHLASYANDPKAKAELMRLMAPTSQLFAEWAGMMQNGAYGTAIFGKSGSSGEKGGREAETAGSFKPYPPGSKASGAKTSGSASGGSAVTLAQLADRVARLEERLARCEAGHSGKAETAKPKNGPRAKS